ncbi:hypothetical protein G9A89_003236 [Geosiphon pyriformis]|nr:hypothetical protein G9A89_003236 [Geosiphon pyriformis]
MSRFSSLVGKRKNPFAESGTTQPRKTFCNSAKENQIHAYTRQLLLAGQRKLNQQAQQKLNCISNSERLLLATSSSSAYIVNSQREISNTCYSCGKVEGDIRCAFCERDLCGQCQMPCLVCREIFCRTCSISKYNHRYKYYGTKTRNDF